MECYAMIVETRYVEKAKLTDEEVWLRAYCASMSNNDDSAEWYSDANECLEDFKYRFRQNERT